MDAVADFPTDLLLPLGQGVDARVGVVVRATSGHRSGQLWQRAAGDLCGFGGVESVGAEHALGVDDSRVLVEGAAEHRVHDGDQGAAAGVQGDRGVGRAEAARRDPPLEVLGRRLAQDPVDDQEADVEPDQQPTPVRVGAGGFEQVAMGDAAPLGDVGDLFLAEPKQPLLLGQRLLEQCRDQLSRTMTLVPGDIIATGTPAGVGGFKGLFLKDGDTVEVEVEGLGAVSNPIRVEA